MSLDPAIFRALVANGASPEMLLAVVEASAAVDEERLERTRAGNAERQQRFREARKAESNDSNALQGVTERDSVTSPPSLDKSPQTPKINPNPAHTQGGVPVRTRGGGFACPEGVDPQHWSDFLANRKSKRLTNTATAYAGILEKLQTFADDEWPPGRIVELAAQRGWGGIVDPHEALGTPRNGNRPSNDFTGHRRNRSAEIDDAARNLGFG